MTADEHTLDHPSEHLVQNLATAVEGALWRFDPLRQTQSHLGVIADASGVTLHGNVRSEVMKAVAGELARKVPGVKSVSNQLVADTELERRVAVKLAMDAEVGLITDKMNVSSLLGTIFLCGDATGASLVEAEAVKSKAEALVRALAGVQNVVNDLHAAVGGADTGAAGEGEAVPAAGGGGMDEAAVQARLAVWRERAAAAAG